MYSLRFSLNILFIVIFTLSTVVLTETEKELTTSTTTTLHPRPTTTTATTTASPAPKPIIPTFDVEDKEGNSCIIVQSYTKLTINYYGENGTILSEDFDLKSETITSSGQCENGTYIKLHWSPKNGSPAHLWNITMDFAYIDTILSFNSADKKYGVNNLSLEYFLEEQLFPGTNYTGPVKVSASGEFFKAKIGNYYQCDAKEHAKLTGLKNQTSGVLIQTQDTKIEAFVQSKQKSHFVGSPEPCAAENSTSSLVPILVGVGLAIMILIALVVFLVGSRRRAAAYESL